MKTNSSRARSSASDKESSLPFFSKNGEHSFFGNTTEKQPPPFFSPSSIQAKFAIDPPGDNYEQEANALSEAVLRSESTTGKTNDVKAVQRKCATCEEEEGLQTKPKKHEAPGVQLWGDPMIQRADLSKAPANLPCNLATGTGIPNGSHAMFQVNSFNLTSASKTNIQNFSTAWKAGGSINDVHVSGFASVDGPEDVNWRLSCKRAEVVRDALVTEGIPTQNIDLWAHGETDEFSAASLPANRRAVIASYTPTAGTVPAPGPGGGAGTRMPFGRWTISQANTDGPGGTRYTSRVNLGFVPDAKTVDCDEVAFVQNVRVIDAKNRTSQDPRANFKNRVTKTGWTIDRLDARKYGWYGYNNNGKPSGTVSPGSAPKPTKTATLSDTPGWNVSNLIWDFETCAICKSGAQANTVYDCLTWGFDVDANNKLTSHVARTFPKPSGEFAAAVAKWNAQASGPKAKRNHPDQEALGPFN